MRSNSDLETNVYNVLLYLCCLLILVVSSLLPSLSLLFHCVFVLFFSFFQVYVVVGIAGVALTGCVLMVIILKYGRNSNFGIKGELIFLQRLIVIVRD